MLDLGIVRPGTTIYVPFQTYDSNDPQASVTISGLATTDIEIYKDGSVTQRASDAGYALLDTDGIDFDSTTGIHGVSINLADNTTAGFYAAGSQYWVVIASITVDAATINFIPVTFRIGYPDAIINTTIATLSSQTSFTLTSGPAEDDALNGCVVCIHDVASAVQLGFGVITDYVGSTKTVTLAAGTTFTAAASDNIAIYPPTNVSYVTGTSQTAGDLAALITTVDTVVDGIQTDLDNGTDGLGAIKADTAAILTDTADMQPKLGTPAGASISADIATIDSNVDAILVDTGTTLPGILGTPTDLGGGATLAANNTDMAGATFSSATDSQEAIRDRGDAAWTTGAGGSPPTTLQNTTIATLASQTSFTLTAGSADNDAYNGMIAVVTDQSTSTQKCVGKISDYVGSTKTVTLGADPGVFTMAVGDTIDIIAVNDRVTLVDTTTTNTDMRGTDNALLAASAPTNFGDMAITVTTGQVTVGTNNDKTGYSISGTKTTLDALNDVSTAQVNTEADTALSDFFTSPATLVDLVWDEPLTAATHNVVNSSGRRLRALQDFQGYEQGLIWIDTVNGTAGTTDYENGTVENPVDTLANATTISGSVGINAFHIANGSSLTLAQTYNNYDFVGESWTLALGGQNIGGSFFRNATQGVTGTGTGTNPFFEECSIGAATLPPCAFDRCGFTSTLTLGSAGDYFLVDCFSQVAGSGAPTIDMGAAVGATNVSIRRWSGGLTLNNVQAGDVVSVDVVSGGTITVNGTGGTVVIRGLCNVTDGSGGSVTITQTSVVNMTKINAEVDTALTDYDAATGTELAAVDTKIDTIDTNVDAILVDTGTTIPGVLGTPAGADLATDIAAVQTDVTALRGVAKKNTAKSNIEFLMIDSTDDVSPKTGLTVTGQRSIDGGAFGAVSGAIAEVASGIYQFDAAAADMNGDVITFKFSSTGANDTFITIYTT